MAFKIRFSGPLLGLLLCGGLMGTPRPAQAQTVYYTPRALLSAFFPTSQAVSYRKFDLTPEARERLGRRLGAPLRKATFTVYVAKTGETVDGYAVIDDEMGQHQPITFGVKFTPTGAVSRQEILVYRERYGDEVRDDRFRKQFLGKTVADPLRPGEDVVAVSGATISSRAMAIGVRRALLLLDELVLQPQRVRSAAAVTPPSP
jgi:hypothetical protein